MSESESESEGVEYEGFERIEADNSLKFEDVSDANCELWLFRLPNEVSL